MLTKYPEAESRGRPGFWTLKTQIYFPCIGLALIVTTGCAPMVKTPVSTSAPSWMPPNPPVGFFIPPGLFGKPAAGVASSPDAPRQAEVLSQPFSPGVDASGPATGSWLPEVPLNASSATQTYFASGGVDAKANQRAWEVLIRKYKIPFKSIASAERLETLASGVLLLPSSVVLSQRENKLC